MSTSCCRSFLSFLLKFLNFLQTFMGVSIILYSIWMLNQWNHHIPIPSAPSPDSPAPGLPNLEAMVVSHRIAPLNFAVDMGSGFDSGLELHLPAPWFIYIFMGVGIVLCCITCIGHIAAEAINGCCLCFYTLLITILMLLEGAFVAYIAIDHHWEKDLPADPTGEFESLRSFIEENADICTWVGIVVVVIQALSLLLAMILRAMVSSYRADYDSDEDCAVVRGRAWEPLLHAQLGQSSGSIKGDGKTAHSDIWSSRMREKYGLNSSDAKYNLLNQKP
ncbi:tetraspanin-18-like isoform X2 [Malania oleifera]|uniref:tetraspanin-18-like isoform X2 n=1 Tax=Malania oleifera TaxID=397392 RepID=UPI0025AEC30E|nr:tetraspanin-18-like isoform X2 [Malania oleifera]